MLLRKCRWTLCWSFSTPTVALILQSRSSFFWACVCSAIARVTNITRHGCSKIRRHGRYRQRRRVASRVGREIYERWLGLLRKVSEIPLATLAVSTNMLYSGLQRLAPFTTSCRCCLQLHRFTQAPMSEFCSMMTDI